MILRRARKQIPVDPRRYTRDYFLNQCGGYDVYEQMQGKVLDERLSVILHLCKIAPAMKVLDIGCGRGELVYHACVSGAQVWGFDISPDALAISKCTISQVPKSATGSYALCRGTSLRLPFKEDSFHRVILSDIVEHLVPWELSVTLREVWRVLKPSGMAIIHTFPNRWFYDLFYPLKRCFLDRPRGKAGPKNPRTPVERELHVNELSPLELWRCLRNLFRVKIWCAHRSRWDSALGKFRTPLGPLSLFIEPEIWSVAWPRR